MTATTRGVRVVLRDGSEVRIDRLHRSDAAMLAEGFASLSAESRRLRFLTDKVRLSPEELAYFTQVDHHDHEAIGAMEPTGEHGLGVARFIRDREDPEVAEIAVAVVDAWQGRGLGTELLTRIMDRAYAEGVRRVTAVVAADNDVMIRVLHDVGADLHVTDRGSGVIDYEFTLEPAGRTKLLDLLRVFGQRQLLAPQRLFDALTAMAPERLQPASGTEDDAVPPAEPDRPEPDRPADEQ